MGNDTTSKRRFAAILDSVPGALADFIREPLAEILRVVSGFRAAAITPQATFEFERTLQGLLRELGRRLVAWTFNHMDAEQPEALPDAIDVLGERYRRRCRSPRRGTIATLFGSIELTRWLQIIGGVRPILYAYSLGKGQETIKQLTSSSGQEVRTLVEGAISVSDRLTFEQLVLRDAKRPQHSQLPQRRMSRHDGDLVEEPGSARDRLRKNQRDLILAAHHALDLPVTHPERITGWRVQRGVHQDLHGVSNVVGREGCAV